MLKFHYNLVLLLAMSLLSWQTAFAQPSPTDCILMAPDITTFIEDGISLDNHGWTCSDPNSLPVISAAATATDLTGFADFTITRNCNFGNDNPADVWYKFIPTVANLNAWVDLYQGSANPDDMVIELYCVTSPIGGTCSTPTGNIAYLGCSDSGFGQFAERERATCTGLNGDRIDVSGLTMGTMYYLRIFLSTANTADVDFSLCAEVSTPIAPAVDNCVDLDNLSTMNDGMIGPTAGCGNSSITGRDVTITYFNQSNAGSFGNAAGGFVDNNLAAPCNASSYSENSTLPLSATGTAIKDVGCDDDTNNDNSGVVVNNVLNNNVMYAIRVEPDPCDPTNDVTVKLSFSNMEATPIDGAIQGTIIGPLNGDGTDIEACRNGGPTIFTFSHQPQVDDCITIINADDFIAGTFLVMIEGSSGTLIKWDMVIDIQYNATCSDNTPPCDMVMGDGTIGTLGVELVGFEGRAENGGNRLEWLTATEKDNKLFEVERSFDGHDFTKIGTVDGKGTNNKEQYYVYFDNTAPSNAYYRLKTVSYTNKVDYSKIVQINRKVGILNINSVYPVPVAHEANLSFNTNAVGTATITLSDVFGKTVSVKEVDTIAGENQEIIDMNRQTAGVYFVTINYKGHQVVQRIVKN